jgi:hypothetical protein
VSADDADAPAFNVFTRRDGTIRNFWRSEMGAATADPGQDPHDAPVLVRFWTILDVTPEGAARIGIRSWITRHNAKAQRFGSSRDHRRDCSGWRTVVSRNDTGGSPCGAHGARVPA